MSTLIHSDEISRAILDRARYAAKAIREGKATYAAACAHEAVTLARLLDRRARTSNAAWNERAMLLRRRAIYHCSLRAMDEC